MTTGQVANKVMVLGRDVAPSLLCHFSKSFVMVGPVQAVGFMVQLS